jgi:hypothetical protein
MTLIYANNLALYHCALMSLPLILVASSHLNCRLPARMMSQSELIISFMPVGIHLLRRPKILRSTKLMGALFNVLGLTQLTQA